MQYPFRVYLHRLGEGCYTNPVGLTHPSPRHSPRPLETVGLAGSFVMLFCEAVIIISSVNPSKLMACGVTGRQWVTKASSPPFSSLATPLYANHAFCFGEKRAKKVRSAGGQTTSTGVFAGGVAHNTQTQGSATQLKSITPTTS